MTQKEMQLLVPQKLREIEKEYGIRVLYAAESGSRAWGTCSPESDYDIRFLYIRPARDYLRLDPVRDVLEFPISDDWDMCGWDLAKALRLLRGANTQIYEWFSSPLVYVDDGFSQRIRPILETCFSLRSAVYHYLHQAALKHAQAMKTETPKVKHYLYCLQHLGAARWVLAHRAPVPISYREVTAQLPQQIQAEAETFLRLKTTQPELPRIERMPQLDAWMEEERERIQQFLRQMPSPVEVEWSQMNDFFLSELDRL